MRTNASEDEPSAREKSVSGEFSKRITPTFGVSVGVEHRRLEPSGQPSISGMGNVELGLKYQFHQDDAHETILSTGLGWEVGGTGNRAVGADSFSTFTSTLCFGKGFGDLPASVPYLKPFAATVSVAPTQMKLWFSEAVAPASSTVLVTDSKGQRVGKGDAQVDRAAPKLMRVSLGSLGSGEYMVVWRAMSTDGHFTAGDFVFHVGR